MKSDNDILVGIPGTAAYEVWPRRFLRWLGACLLLFALAGRGIAESGGDREYDIKAAFLYRFCHYVDWQGENNPDSGDTVTIGILGENPFGSALDPLTFKTVKGKKVVIRQLQNVQDAGHCQVVFISASEKGRLPQILDALQHHCVLTVSEVDGFAQHGGIINLIAEGNKVRFEINPVAAEKARLNLNPQLLKVARVVKS